MPARQSKTTVFPAVTAEMERSEMTHGQLAVAADLGPSHLSQILNGTVVASPRIRRRIADALGVDDLDRLFDLASDVRRMIDDAVRQGLAPSVEDPHVLQGVSHFLVAHRNAERRVS